MLTIDRKKLVAELLVSSKCAAEEEARAINEEKDVTLEFIYLHLRRYVLAKYMLPPDYAEDDIKALARESLQRTLKVDKNALHKLDLATPCNSATSESAKKVLLLYAVQKDLHLPESPAKLAAVETVTALAEYVYEMRSDRVSGV